MCAICFWRWKALPDKVRQNIPQLKLKFCLLTQTRILNIWLNIKSTLLSWQPSSSAFRYFCWHTLISEWVSNCGLVRPLGTLITREMNVFWAPKNDLSRWWPLLSELSVFVGFLGTFFTVPPWLFQALWGELEQRQNKNDSIQSKTIPILKFPPFSLTV